MKASEWISVDDKLPKEFTWLLAYQDGAMATIAFSPTKGFHHIYPIHTQLMVSDITHYQYLPESPEE